MRIYGLTLAQLEVIAKELGFRLENPREGGVVKPWVAFTIRMALPLPKGKAGREDPMHPAMRYRARSGISIAWGKPRYAGGAVCWHGHKVFLERCLAANPAIRFQSKLWKFTGIDEFKARVDETGYVNVGNRLVHVQAREACDCYGG